MCTYILITLFMHPLPFYEWCGGDPPTAQKQKLIEDRISGKFFRIFIFSFLDKAGENKKTLLVDDLRGADVYIIMAK